MGRTPCCEKTGLNKGKWTAEEDEKLIGYIKANGDGSWRSVPKNAGLLRCGKSCRLRWMNYLRDDVKRGMFTEEEDETIVKLHKTFGNKFLHGANYVAFTYFSRHRCNLAERVCLVMHAIRWSLIASNLPGRTDNEIKNYWNSHLSRRIYRYRSMGGLTEADLIKIMTGAYKKPRAAPKKYVSFAHSHDIAAGVDDDEIYANAEENESNRMGEDKESYPFENKEAGGVNTTTGWLHGSKLFASPNEVIEGDDLGQWGPVDEDIIMHVEQFLVEEDKTAVDVKGSVTERECVEGRLNIENMGLHACFSPTIPYYNDDVLGWDHVNGGEEEFHLWNFGEEGDMMINLVLDTKS